MAKVGEEWLTYPVIPYETTDALRMENKQLVVSIKQHVLSCNRDIREIFEILPRSYIALSWGTINLRIKIIAVLCTDRKADICVYQTRARRRSKELQGGSYMLTWRSCLSDINDKNS